MSVTLTIYPFGGPPPKPPPPTSGWQSSGPAVLVPATVLVPGNNSSFTPAGFIRSDVPYGWNGIQLESRLATPFPVVEQDFSPKPSPQRFVAANTTYGGQSLYGVGPEKFIPLFPVPAQQFNAFQPRGNVPYEPGPEGWWGIQLESRLAAPFPAAAQQFFIYDPTHIPTTEEVYGWFGIQLEYRIAPSFPVPEQQFTNTYPQFGNVPLKVGQEGWRGIQLDSQLARPFPAPAQQFLAYIPEHVPIAADVEGFFGIELDYRFAAPFPVAEQRFNDFEPAGFIRSDVPYGWWGIQLDARLAKPFPAPAQQFYAGVSRFGLNAVDVQGWYGIQLEFKLASPFPAPQQLFQAYQTEGSVPYEPGPEGWWGIQLNAQLGRPFPAVAQQFLAYIPEHVPATVDIEGFFGIELDYRFATPFPIAEQRFNDFEPAGFIRSDVPYGFWGVQLDSRLSKPFPVVAQLFTAHYPQRGNVPYEPGPEGWWGILLEPRLVLVPPFPVTQQVFWIYGADYFIPPPGSGKKPQVTGVYPDAPWQQKPQKPFKPVWDKPRGGEIEQHPVPPAQPLVAGLPPLSIFERPSKPSRLDLSKLPTFENLVPHDPIGIEKRIHEAQDVSDATRVVGADKQMQEIQDLSDALHLLKMLGLLPNDDDPALK